MKDKIGYEIPPMIEADWKKAEQFQNMLTTLQRVKLYVENAVNKNELVFREVDQEAHIDISNAIRALKRVLPYAVCPTCQGRIREQCTTCRQRGFISNLCGMFAYRSRQNKYVSALLSRQWSNIESKKTITRSQSGAANKL